MAPARHHARMNATQEGLWKAVTERDPNADGLFVYAVKSTGIFCRPSCASRKPRRERVDFFPAAEMAVAGGYRPCRRCRPDENHDGPPSLGRVRRVCAALATRPDAPWTTARLARVAGTSAVQLQRAFRDVLGLSPRDYMAACRRRRFLETLRNGHSVTDAVYAAGYGSPSRVYDAVRLPGMTPATYGRGGRGAAIHWTTTDSAVGSVVNRSSASRMNVNSSTTVGSSSPRATTSGWAARPSTGTGTSPARSQARVGDMAGIVAARGGPSSTRALRRRSRR